MGAVQTAFDFAVPRAVRAPRERVPEPEHALRAVPEAQLPHALSGYLARTLDARVKVQFTDNARTMLSYREHAGVAHVRLHHMFADAPPPVVATIAEYLRDGRTEAEAELSAYIDQHRDRIRRPARRAAAPRARGRCHDLCELLDSLNQRYFDGALQTTIGWSKMGRPSGRRRKRRSIKLGSYRERDALIRVHPVLDQDWVPRFFVEYVVFHEMLHHVLGIGVREGKRRMHTPEFRRRERAFPYHEEATAWEAAHLSRLLSS